METTHLFKAHSSRSCINSVVRLIDVLIKDAVCLSARDGAGSSRSDSDVCSGATLIKHDSWETHKRNGPFISDEDTDALAL